jgi:hypothetical protein
MRIQSIQTDHHYDQPPHPDTHLSLSVHVRSVSLNVSLRWEPVVSAGVQGLIVAVVMGANILNPAILEH